MPSRRYDIDEMPDVFPEEDRIAVRFASGRVHVWKPHRLRNFIMVATKVLSDFEKRPDSTVQFPKRPKIIRVAGEDC